MASAWPRAVSGSPDANAVMARSGIRSAQPSGSDSSQARWNAVSAWAARAASVPR